MGILATAAGKPKMTNASVSSGSLGVFISAKSRVDRVARGDRVQVLCASRLDDGSWLDDEASRRVPFWLKAGEPTKLQAVTDALVGMQVGERKTVVVTPQAAYGRPDPDKIVQVARRALPRAASVGDRVEVAGKPVVIVALSPKEATVDGNHALAGRTLTVEIEVVARDR